MLRMMRDRGVRDQVLFSLPQYEFKRTDGTPVRFGNGCRDGPGGRARPQFLTEALANRVLRGNLMQVDVAAKTDHDQPEGNDGVRLKGAHEIDATLSSRNWHGMIVFNMDFTRRDAYD